MSQVEFKDTTDVQWQNTNDVIWWFNFVASVGSAYNLLDEIFESVIDITPDDSNGLGKHGIVFVGTSGDLKIDDDKGRTVTILQAPAGIVLPMKVAKVYASGTTAANLVLLY